MGDSDSHSQIQQLGYLLHLLLPMKLIGFQTAGHFIKLTSTPQAYLVFPAQAGTGLLVPQLSAIIHQRKELWILWSKYGPHPIQQKKRLVFNDVKRCGTPNGSNIGLKIGPKNGANRPEQCP